MNIEALREAWSLYQTDSRAETAIAVALVLLFVGPVVYQFWQAREARESGSRNVLGGGV